MRANYPSTSQGKYKMSRQSFRDNFQWFYMMTDEAIMHLKEKILSDQENFRAWDKYMMPIFWREDISAMWGCVPVLHTATSLIAAVGSLPTPMSKSTCWRR
jgi:hypothetical protein